MTTVVVYDASVLYPSTLRDLLLRLAQTDLVRARWTERILDEVFTSLRRNRPGLDPAKLNRTRILMGQAVRDWRIDDYEHHIDNLTLPDPDDLHVLAAAIHTRADMLVTANLRDFPHDTLRQHGITPQHPDAFVLDQAPTPSPILSCNSFETSPPPGVTHPAPPTPSWTASNVRG